jgi:DNA-binding transcriptional regulator YdaS (Cro superfamily)
MHKAALLKTIQIFDNNQTVLATALGISRKRLNNWLNRDKKIPEYYAILIEKLTNGAVSCDELSPGISISKELLVQTPDNAAGQFANDLNTYFKSIHEDFKHQFESVHFVLNEIKHELKEKISIKEKKHMKKFNDKMGE